MKKIDCFEVRRSARSGTPSQHVAFFAEKAEAERAAIECSAYGEVHARTLKINETWADYKGLAHVDLVRVALDKLTPDEITLLGIARLAKDARQ